MKPTSFGRSLLLLLAFIAANLLNASPARALVGDYNHNGFVDPADYSVWRDTLGSVTPPGAAGDGNFDGTVTQADYEVWKLSFTPQNILSSVAPVSPNIAIVPLGHNGLGNSVWSVRFTPRTDLFATSPLWGFSASAAVEIGLTVSGANLITATRNITDFPVDNPGDSPFAFGGPPSLGLSTSGNQIFGAFGGNYFTTGAPREMFQFQTTAGAHPSVAYEALYATGGQNFLTSGTVFGVPEPTSCALLQFGTTPLLGLFRRHRR